MCRKFRVKYGLKVVQDGPNVVSSCLATTTSGSSKSFSHSKTSIQHQNHRRDSKTHLTGHIMTKTITSCNYKCETAIDRRLKNRCPFTHFTCMMSQELLPSDKSRRFYKKEAEKEQIKIGKISQYQTR